MTTEIHTRYILHVVSSESVKAENHDPFNVPMFGMTRGHQNHQPEELEIHDLKRKINSRRVRNAPVRILECSFDKLFSW
jgi:hypothetical protein